MLFKSHQKTDEESSIGERLTKGRVKHFFISVPQILFYSELD